MNRILAIVIAMLALVAGVVTFYALDRLSATGDQTRHVTMLSAPRPLPDFALVNQSGHSVTPETFKGRWSVLFFGFTHCPDICPTTLYDLARLKKAVGDLPATDQPAVYLVSVDPGRDTPEQLARYVSTFDDSFTGVTGDPEQLDTLARALGAAYGIEPDGQGGYDVLHTAALFILGPDGRFMGVASPPHKVPELAQDYRILVRAPRA